MAETSIEWTDATWNPVRGCTKVSPGCKHCYAEAFAERFRGVKGHPYEQGFDVRLVPEALDVPLHWRTPRRVFVNSMSDLFHEDVPDAFIMRVWLRMAATPQHTYQILTKRPERMKRWIARWSDTAGDAEPRLARGPGELRAAHTSGRALMFAEVLDGMGEPPDGCAFPTYDWMEGPRWLPAVLPNAWLGVSVENQAAADERIPHLLATPAAVRFLSCEPLLGPVFLRSGVYEVPGGRHVGTSLVGIDWVIVGGESGPKARPCDVAWIRAIVEQCRAAAVPCFVKQLGSVPVMTAAAWHALELRGEPVPLLTSPRASVPAECVQLAQGNRKGGDMRWWPSDLRIREWPRERSSRGGAK